jgi:FMN-dependent NADH-azoreductase
VPKLLQLDSSADLETSRSRAITHAFAEAWTARGDDYTITYRDLHREPLPHLAAAELHWPAHLRRAGSPTPPADAEALQKSIIDELLTADVLLVGAPLYNYSMPSTLKAWIDYIHVPAVTFGDVQPLAARPAVIVTSRGGSYDEGSPTEGWDHAVPALQIVLGNALGMDVSVITTSLTLAEQMGSPAENIERSRRELAEALEQAAALASTV